MIHPYNERQLKEIGWARARLAEQKWCMLDTEATGLKRHLHEVIEVALVSPEGGILFQSLVKTQHFPLPDNLKTDIHGITHGMLSSAPTWPEIFPGFLEVLGQHEGVVVYNARFDQELLEGTLRRYGLTLPPLEWHCLFNSFRRFYGEWDESHGDWRFQSLDTACASFGRDRGKEKHRAATDATDALFVLEQLAALPLPDGKEEEENEEEAFDPYLSGLD